LLPRIQKRKQNVAYSNASCLFVPIFEMMALHRWQPYRSTYREKMLLHFAARHAPRHAQLRVVRVTTACMLRKGHKTAPSSRWQQCYAGTPPRPAEGVQAVNRTPKGAGQHIKTLE
jgi:hypothetical protein